MMPMASSSVVFSSQLGGGQSIRGGVSRIVFDRLAAGGLEFGLARGAVRFRRTHSHTSSEGESHKPMRVRDHEIKQRRQRRLKRRRIRKQLAAATSDAQKQALEAKMEKTYPGYRPAS